MSYGDPRSEHTVLPGVTTAISTSSSPMIEPHERDGLSRRPSWNSTQDEERNLHSDHSAHSRSVSEHLRGWEPPSAPKGTEISNPHDWASGYAEQDIGLGYGRRSSEVSADSRHEVQRMHLGRAPGYHRPFFQQVNSSGSVDSAHSPTGSTSPENGGTSRVPSMDHPNRDTTPLRDGSSDMFRRAGRRRAYNADGYARSPLNLATTVMRSPTFKAVSATFRHASFRVANMMGGEDRGTKLPNDGAKWDDGKGGEFEMGEVHEEPEVAYEGMTASPSAVTSGPHAKLVDEEVGRLRGKTLFVFGPDSWLRRAMAAALHFQWTEPVILILIIAYAIVLTIQASRPIYDPRPGNGYFHSWEDFAILAIFTVFTIEMFARIITTGLLFDPETSVRMWLRAPGGIVSRLSDSVERAQNRLSGQVPESIDAPRAAWRSVSDGSRRAERKATLIPEAPFQSAVQKQRHLSVQSRPYLRHSWHRVDLVSIVAFWITFLISIFQREATDEYHLYIFRALSVLRAGRLLVITSGTTTILDSLKRAAPLLVTVGFFVIFAAALFSIIGVQSFRGSFRRTCQYSDPLNSTNSISLSQQCGGFLDPTSFNDLPYLLRSGSPYPQGSKGYICPSNQICQQGNTNPEGDSQSFDNFFYALMQVVVIASINTWAPVMYQAMDSDYFASALYWIVGVIIINFWLINLVVAVVVNTLKAVRADTKKSAFGADDSIVGADPSWATQNKKKADGPILRFYRKTELFWVALVLVSLGAQAFKTSDSSDNMLEILAHIELAATLAFDVDIALRIVAYFPHWSEFMASPRNMFDLFLAVASSIIQIPAIASDPVYPWLTVFQLLRWYRFVLAFPRMKPLLLQVFGSFAGLLNMTIFLFLMNYLAALFAVQLFRGDLEDDNLISFSQTYNAFLGMYQIFSSENWTDPLYNAMEAETQWRQKWIAAIFLCAWLVFSYFVVLQMFVAVINENFQIAEEQKRKQQVEEFIRRGEPQSAHVSWIDRLNPYRLMKAHHNAVRVSNLPQNLVLPLKQTVGGDVGGAAPQATLPELDFTKQKLRQMMGRPREESTVTRRKHRRSTAVLNDKPDDDDDDRGLSDLLPPVNDSSARDEAADASRERRNQQADFIMAHPSFDVSLWIFKQGNPVRRFCQACFDSAYGDRIFGRSAHPVLRLLVKTIILLTIVASIVVAAISTPIYRKWYYGQNGYLRGAWFDIVEAGLSGVFVVEAIMKIIADGFIFAPNAYLLSVWNILDFIILLALLLNMLTSLIVIGGVSRFTRAARAVRALRLITLFSRLRDTLHVVLFAGFIKILDASILMILYIIPFAVWGLNIFSGKLLGCTDTSVSGIASCIGESLISPVDDTLNFLAPMVWADPGLTGGETMWSFNSFRQSMLILFEIVSLEGWIDVMGSAMSIVGIGQQPQENAAQWNSIFFIIFNLFGAVIILTLFVSIIIENFSLRSGMALLTTEQRRWVDLTKFIKAQTPSQLPRHRPTEGFRGWCFERATNKHGWWARMFTLIYYLHIIVLAFEDFNNTILNDTQFDFLFLGLTFLYAIDLLVRFIGVGMRSFWANGWNIFDFVVITGSFVTTVPALQAAASGGLANQVNVQLQKLFLVAIGLKLVQRNSRLNQLFKTSVASLPAIGNLFLLWACLFMFFAIMFVEVFGLTKNGNNAGSRFQNYNTFGSALVMLAFMSTGEGWNGYMHDYTIQAPRCTSSANFLDSDCGSPPWAFSLFISWNILSMYIFLNMFTGVVVESFAYVYQMPGGASLDREQMRAFKRVWAQFDIKRTGYIRRKDFVPFFARLTGVFDVKLYPSQFSIPNLMRTAIPDPIDHAAGRLLVASGTRRAVDVRRLQNLVTQIDFEKVRERRRLFTRLYNEARISEEPGRGISFTSMLVMLAHYKLIDDEKALLLDDLLERRARVERVTDLVNLDRVRGLLRTIYWRRHFLHAREQHKRTLTSEGAGIPAIVLDPIGSPPENGDGNPFHDHEYHLPESPASSPRSSADGSPRLRASHVPLSPSLSATTPGLTRHSSRSGRLSSEDADRSRESLLEDPMDMNEVAATSMWDDMMREAVDREDEQ